MTGNDGKGNSRDFAKHRDFIYRMKPIRLIGRIDIGKMNQELIIWLPVPKLNKYDNVFELGLNSNRRKIIELCDMFSVNYEGNKLQGLLKNLFDEYEMDKRNNNIVGDERLKDLKYTLLSWYSTTA